MRSQKIKAHKYVGMAFLLFLMGAGPCSVMELEADKEKERDDTEEDDAKASSEEDCEQSGEVCIHSLGIQILLAGDDAFKEGMYRFKIVAPDDSKYSIDCYLVNQNDSLECQNGDLNDLYAYIGEDRTVMNFGIVGAPPSLDFELQHNDFSLVNKRITPVYDLSYPNGEGCEPTCYNGMAHIAVTFR